MGGLAKAADGAGAGGLDIVERLIREIAKEPPAEIALDTRLDELELDSLQRLELLVLIEERYGIRLPDEYLDAPSVGDIARAVSYAA